MIVQLEMWHLIYMLIAFFSCIGTFGAVLLSQFDKRQAARFKAQDAASLAEQKRQDERFNSQEASRAQAQEHWDRRFTSLESAAKEWSRVERDFLEWKAELPMTFVMRADYVRNQTVIEAKLDSVATRIENLKLKGALNEQH